jgi:mannose-6-phosphate isomerase-like protein (cupin superfamily)
VRTSIHAISQYTTLDGSLIRELMHPDTHGNRNQSLALAVIEQGGRTELHMHHASEEIYHILQGRGVMTLGDEQFSVQAGDTICIQPGVLHRIINTWNESLRIFCCCAPPYSHSDTEILQERG